MLLLHVVLSLSLFLFWMFIRVQGSGRAFRHLPEFRGCLHATYTPLTHILHASYTPLTGGSGRAFRHLRISEFSANLRTYVRHTLKEAVDHRRLQRMSSPRIRKIRLQELRKRLEEDED